MSGEKGTDTMQDYKSIRAAVMIDASLVNILTHRHTVRQTHTQTK